MFNITESGTNVWKTTHIIIVEHTISVELTN